MDSAYKRVSVIIEWKNQDLAEDRRAEQMLDALREQWSEIAEGRTRSANAEALRDLDCRCEILLVHDGAAGSTQLRGRIATRFGPRAEHFDLRIIDGIGLTYYQMKQCGADLASGDILVFLDSDVIPQPGWLPALLGALFTDGVQIVCGNTYIEPSGLLGKAFALGWFFPLRSDRDDLECGARCYSNNIAFAHDTFRRYPFQPIPGSTRSGMTGLLRRLETDGASVYKCHAAQVSHPAPNGWVHLARRSLAQGRDNYLKSGRDGLEGWRQWSVATEESWRRLRSGLQRTFIRHQAVGASGLELPAVTGIIVIYYAIAAVGTLATHIAPGPMTRRLQL